MGNFSNYLYSRLRFHIFSFIFTIADVRIPILGADFIKRYGLSIDLSTDSITDKTTNITKNFNRTHCSNVTHSVTHKHDFNDKYRDLVDKYPELVNPNLRNPTIEHNVKHHIITNGNPVFCRPRPLPPDKLKIAKAQFQAMIDSGVCRPSAQVVHGPVHS